MLKRTLLFVTAACSAVPLHGIAQNPPTPPSLVAPAPLTSPAPPVPPAPLSAPTPVSNTKDHRSSVFLGVDTAPVPAALSDQLNLAEGFGLLVDYVVPGSAADVAGVKAYDILKMLNDQILTSEEQLSVLVRSFSEGQEVTLAVLRKGQETKLTAKLQKREGRDSDFPFRRELRLRRDGRTDGNNGDFHFDFSDVANPDFAERIRESVERNSAQIEAATDRANEQVKRAMEAVRERTARASGTRLDLDGAHILLRDSTGRIEIRSSRGKRTLTIRDAAGKKVFDGPIDTPEQRKGIPANSLPQVEALEREQTVTFPKRSGKSSDEDGDDAD